MIAFSLPAFVSYLGVDRRVETIRFAVSAAWSFLRLDDLELGFDMHLWYHETWAYGEFFFDGRVLRREACGLYPRPEGRGFTPSRIKPDSKGEFRFKGVDDSFVQAVKHGNFDVAIGLASLGYPRDARLLNFSEVPASHAEALSASLRAASHEDPLRLAQIETELLESNATGLDGTALAMTKEPYNLFSTPAIAEVEPEPVEFSNPTIGQIVGKLGKNKHVASQPKPQAPIRR